MQLLGATIELVETVIVETFGGFEGSDVAVASTASSSGRGRSGNKDRDSVRKFLNGVEHDNWVPYDGNDGSDLRRLGRGEMELTGVRRALQVVYQPGSVLINDFEDIGTSFHIHFYIHHALCSTKKSEIYSSVLDIHISSQYVYRLRRSVH